MDELISRERARHEFALFFQDSKSLVEDCDSLLCMLPTIDALVLPCKVGDAVYMEIGDDETPHFVDTGKVFAIGIDESGTVWISVRYESGLKFYHTSDDIGKTCFLTSEEAEAALAKNGR